MKTEYDLSTLYWKLTGFAPFQWLALGSAPLSDAPMAEVPAIPAPVPGSVQKALLDAGIIKDWNVALNARDCEWVENRHWAYEAVLPPEWLKAGAGSGKARASLLCKGLDYSGWVLVNGREAGEFRGSFIPHSFDLTPYLPAEGEARLQIVFDTPPRWLGQFGYTSRMTSWKPRFNYTWDWTSRLVQIGIWDDMALAWTDGDSIESITPISDIFSGSDDWAGVLKTGIQLKSDRGRSINLSLIEGERVLRTETKAVESTDISWLWSELPVRPWWPNGMGQQPLYLLQAELMDENGKILDTASCTIGFRHIEWLSCEGAPDGADPWICAVNGKPVFLQGVNWTPIRPNFADVTADQTAARLQTYRDMGCNVLRVWGGAYLEKESFYRMCDEMGLLVWQEFPLSSSGTENWPSEDPRAMDELCEIAESYIRRRRYHPCLLLWSGGNELQGSLDGGKTGVGRPVDMTHPLMIRFQELTATLDPGRRFIPTSASGPMFTADASNYGKGLHWDVHGPWSMPVSIDEWQKYWNDDDSLFRSEVGCPGASPVVIIEEFKGELPAMPCNFSNPLWRRTSWWIEWDAFIQANGRTPNSLEDYVEWSQARQAEGLKIAASATKARFPGVGGFIIWMGHDSFPCTANTAILDFDGNPKPAALAVKEVFLGESGS